MLQRARSQVLEQINRREPLPVLLGAIAALPEKYFPGVQCSIQLIGGEASPKPSDVSSQVSTRSSCFRPILSANGLSDKTALLGTITAMQDGGTPEDALVEIVDMAAQLAAIAIDNRKLYDGLRDLSLHDALTGLPNRTLLAERLAGEIESLPNGRHLAIAYIDVNDFKAINDLYGHKTGDLFLLSAVGRFKSSLREIDVLARVGGDEFSALLPGVRDRAEANEILQRIVLGLAQPLLLESGLSLPCSVSIGVAVFPEDGADLDALLHRADEAMYAVKSRRKTPLPPPLRISPGDRRISALDLRAAIDSDRLRLHYQAIFSMDGSLTGFESLVRLVDDQGELLAPAEFIETAEKSGLIVPLGNWVLREACRQGCEWERRTDRGLTMAVNISARQFAEEGFVEMVVAILKQTQFPPALLELELTEATVILDLAVALAQMHRLRRLGVKFALDDFRDWVFGFEHGSSSSSRRAEDRSIAGEIHG
jgi:diguanylate cyclase (GGDEF)-like protein